MKLFLSFCVFNFLFIFTNAQEALIKGNILNFPNKTLLMFKCYEDTLVLVDSVSSAPNGDFTLSLKNNRIRSSAYVSKNPTGMYLIWLNKSPKQYFNVLYYNQPLEVKTIFKPDRKRNNAAENLVVFKSDINKAYNELNHLIKKISVVKHSNVSETEYLAAYNAMEEFMKKYLPVKNPTNYKNISSSSDSMFAKIALAYYEPVVPSWKLPKYKRDSILEKHFFDYYNPADSFYLNTNILKDKLDTFITLASSKMDRFGRPYKKLLQQAQAAQKYLDRIKHNEAFFNFHLNYLLKNFKANFKEAEFMYLYDLYLKPKEGDCEAENPQFDWARDYVNIMKNISKGSVAPDFKINDSLNLRQIKSDFTILLFWASWCTHCHEMLPDIKKLLDNFSNQYGNKLSVVAISLDTQMDEWQKYIKENQMNSFINFSELKGWKSQVVKIYNIHMTPSIFVLDKDKKIIAPRLGSAFQLENTFKSIR